MRCKMREWDGIKLWNYILRKRFICSMSFYRYFSSFLGNGKSIHFFSSISTKKSWSKIIVRTCIFYVTSYCAGRIIFASLFILSLTFHIFQLPFGSLTLSSIRYLFIAIVAPQISLDLASFCCISDFLKCMWVEQMPQELWKSLFSGTKDVIFRQRPSLSDTYFVYFYSFIFVHQHYHLHHLH